MLPQERVLRPEGFSDAQGVLPGPQSSLPAPSPSPVLEPSTRRQHLAFGATALGSKEG